MTPMQVRNAGRWLGFAALTAALVHVATVWLLPQLTMNRVMDRTGDRLGFNQVIHLDGAGFAETIVRPDPASLESICAFNLLQGPMRLTVPAGAQHLSVTGVGDNTVQFLGTGGSGAGVDLWIATEEQAPGMEGTVAVSPSRKGIVLIRLLAANPDGRRAADSIRQQIACVGS